MAGIRVLVADSQRTFADALGIALAVTGGFSVLADQPGGGPETIDSVLAHRPDVALIDYWLVGIEGDQVVRAIRERYPSAKVILLSWFFGREQVAAGLEAGAVGFLPKSLSVQEVVDAVRRANEGENPVFGPEMDSLLAGLDLRDSEAKKVATKGFTLTPQERRILILLSLGFSTSDVAEKLFITIGTVRNHVQRIFKKTGAHSQVEAIAIANQHGFIQTGTAPITGDKALAAGEQTTPRGKGRGKRRRVIQPGPKGVR